MTKKAKEIFREIAHIERMAEELSKEGFEKNQNKSWRALSADFPTIVTSESGIHSALALGTKKQKNRKTKKLKKRKTERDFHKFLGSFIKTILGFFFIYCQYLRIYFSLRIILLMDPKLPIRATTQEQIPIEDFQDDLVILKNGACCLILAVTALNFSLLSEPEQEATIYSYAALLNSLNFTIQILVRSKQKDISSYLSILLEEETKQKNPLLLNQIKKYRKFIEETIKRNNVLDKEFFVIIPFSAVELGVSQAITGSLLPKKTALPFPKNYILEKAKINLGPKRDHLIRQFARIGLSAKQLPTKELISLFYEIYNFEQVERQKIFPAAQYTSLLVQSNKNLHVPIPTTPAPNK